MAESTSIRVVVDALEKFVADIVVRLVFEIVATLTAPPSQGGTPRDTGWAAANWVASVGQPFTGTVGSPDSVDFGSQQAALAAVLGFKVSDARAYISNNVPYILKLNEGWSQQAPSAFVQAAIATSVQKVAGK